MAGPGPFDFSPDSSKATVVVPVAGVSKWQTAIYAPALTVPDLAAGEVVCQSPAVVLTNRGLPLTRSVWQGTTLRVRLVYYGYSMQYTSTPLTIRVFGNAGGQSWTVIRNLNGDTSVPIPIDPSYTTPSVHVGSDTHLTVGSTQDPNLFVNQPDNNAHAWDCDGYDEIIVGVESAFSFGANSTLAYLEAKMV